MLSGVTTFCATGEEHKGIHVQYVPIDMAPEMPLMAEMSRSRFDPGGMTLSMTSTLRWALLSSVPYLSQELLVARYDK